MATSIRAASTVILAIRVLPTVVAMAVLTACAPHPPVTAKLPEPVVPQPRPLRSDPERVARCRASAVRSEPPPPPFGRVEYPLPERWNTEELEGILEGVLASARAEGGSARPGSGGIDEVTVDRAAGTVSVLADWRGHERVVILLGGCVLYPEDQHEGWSIAVVALVNLAAADVVLVSGGLSDGVRAVADEPTNSVVFQGPEGEVARREALLLEADCLAASP